MQPTKSVDAAKEAVFICGDDETWMKLVSQHLP
jgi:hypothetical protein